MKGFGVEIQKTKANTRFVQKESRMKFYWSRGEMEILFEASVKGTPKG